MSDSDNDTDPTTHAVAGPIPGPTDAERVGANLARNLIGLRHARHLTQDALAATASLPRSTIANLESGDANPSLAVLVKVAGALQVPIDELLSSPRAKVRRWSAADIDALPRGRGVTERRLVPEPVPDQLASLMHFAPAALMGGTPHLPGTREFFTCLDGRVTIFVAGDRHELGAGDVLAFPGNVPHSYQNPDAVTPARGVSLVVLANAGT